MLQYRLHRLMITLWSSIINRIAMAVSSVKAGSGFKACGIIYFRNFGEIVIGRNVHINSHKIADPIGGDTKTMLLTGRNATLILHDGVSLSNTTIYASEHVEIGEQTCIGGSVKIYDTDFHSVNVGYRLNGNTNVPSKPVYIGKRVFIGGHSIILKGVTIGDEAVVGAGSVVTKNIPAGEIWAGNPARFIKKL